MDGAGKREKKLSLTEPTETDTISGWKCGSYEPTTGIHCDIGYLYTLDLIALSIRVQSVSNFNSKTGTPYKDGESKMKLIDTITDFTETKKVET